MGSIITLVGCGVVVGISFIVDGSGTLKLVISAVSIRGVTWVIKKAIESVDKEKSQLINFTGWCIAGVSIVGILKNCKVGIQPIIKDIGETMETVGEIKKGIMGFKGNLDKFADWMDKLPWN